MAHIKELNLSTRLNTALFDHYDFGRPEVEVEECDGEIYEYPNPKWGWEIITTIERLIELGANGLRKRSGIGKDGINEIAYKISVYMHNNGLHFDLDKFTYIEPPISKPPKAPKDFVQIHPKQSGYVYAINAEDLFVKVGLSRNFPDKRLQGIRTSCPLEVRLSGYIKTEDVCGTELKVHLLLDAFHKRGEWFKIDYNSIKEITKLDWIDHA
jgi:hypothetical protein